MAYTALSQLKADRTRASTRVQSLIKHNVTSEAQWTMPDGLPSWWPFWSDCLYDATRELVRKARALEVAQQQ